MIKASPVCTDSIVSSVLRVLSFNRLCPIWACLTMIYLQLFPLLLKSTLCFSWLANRIGMAIKKLLWVFVSRTTAWKRVRLARTKVIMYTSRGEPIFGTEFCNVLSKKLHNLKVRTIIFALNLNINFDRLKNTFNWWLLYRLTYTTWLWLELAS